MRRGETAPLFERDANACLLGPPSLPPAGSLAVACLPSAWFPQPGESLEFVTVSRGLSQGDSNSLNTGDVVRAGGRVKDKVEAASCDSPQGITYLLLFLCSATVRR